MFGRTSSSGNDSGDEFRVVAEDVRVLLEDGRTHPRQRTALGIQCFNPTPNDAITFDLSPPLKTFVVSPKA